MPAPIADPDGAIVHRRADAERDADRQPGSHVWAFHAPDIGMIPDLAMQGPRAGALWKTGTSAGFRRFVVAWLADPGKSQSHGL
jgi:hypothetical protein